MTTTPIATAEKFNVRLEDPNLKKKNLKYLKDDTGEQFKLNINTLNIPKLGNSTRFSPRRASSYVSSRTHDEAQADQDLVSPIRLHE